MSYPPSPQLPSSSNPLKRSHSPTPPTNLAHHLPANIDNSNVQTWLIRVPPSVHSYIDNADEGSEVGEMVFKAGKSGGFECYFEGINDKPSASDNMEDGDADAAADDDESSGAVTIPTAYAVDGLTKNIPSMHVFSKSNHLPLSINGRITRTSSLSPLHLDSNYRRTMSNRVNDLVKPKRYVQSSSLTSTYNTSNNAIKGNTGGFGDAVMETGGNLLDLKENGGMEEDGSMKYAEFTARGAVFDIFMCSEREGKRILSENAAVSGEFNPAQQLLGESKRYLSLKEIRVISGKDESDIKSVLREVGEYMQKGEWRGKWGLMEKYREGGS